MVDFMTDIRFTYDDLIPLLQCSGIAATLNTWLARNAPEEILTWIISDTSGYDLTSGQLRQLIADLRDKGDLSQADISGDSLPDPITRLAAPTGVGVVAGGNIWCSAPEGSYILRFYVNNVLKTTLADYYITSLESIGAVTGDTVQLCFVSTVDGTVGWWAPKAVP